MATASYKPFYRNSWALVIGINDYQFVAPLAYAGNDADAIASVLVNDLGFSAENTIVLKDSAATKQSILDAFIDFSNKAADLDDRLLVFFAGHGLTAEGIRGPIGYLVPVDGDPDKKNTLIRWDELTRNADLIPAKHILFVMDACYSGLALQRAFPQAHSAFLLTCFSDWHDRSSPQVKPTSRWPMAAAPKEKILFSRDICLKACKVVRLIKAVC
jgi:hypothetical protein